MVNYKFHFRVPVFYLRCSEVFEDRHFGSTSQLLAESLRHADSAAHHHNVNIFGRAVEKNVAHVPSHDVAFQLQLIGSFRYQFEYFVRKVFFKFHLSVF